MSMYPPPSQFQPPKQKSLLRRHPVVVVVFIITAIMVGVMAGCEAAISGSSDGLPDESRNVYMPAMTSVPTGGFTPRGKEVYPIRPYCR